MKSAFGLAILAATLVASLGHNNWDRPCFHGECAYDLPDHTGSSGTVKLISKSPHAIADITPAAGWVVLDCDANALSQDIRLVCKSDDVEGAGCSRFFEGRHGPVDKYLRLPESCSSSPFARVVKYWVHEDQSVPSQHQVTRRDGAAPQVFAVSIDTEFADIDHSKYGDVHFVAYGASLPGIDTNFAIPDNIDERNVADAFMAEALQQLVDRTSAAPFVFTKFNAYITPYYPSGKAASAPPAFKEPEGSKKGDNSFGSETDPWASIELKTEDLSCKKELKNGTFISAGATVTGKVDNFFWGKVQWGGAASGKNGILDKVTGFWNNLNAHFRHELSLTVALVGKAGWEADLGPWAIPGISGLEFGVANIGLLGGLKLEAAISAEAALEFSGKLQYGIDRGLAAAPPLPGKPANPGFKIEGSGFNASLAAAGKAKVSTEVAATPKLMLGASAGSKTSDKKAISSAFLGFEIKFTAEAEASKTFADTAADSASRPSSPKSLSRPGSPKKHRSVDADTELGFCVKVGFDAHVGGEAKIWGLGFSKKLSIWTYEFVIAKGGHLCEDKGKGKRATSEQRKTITPKNNSFKCPASPIKALKNFLKDTPEAKQWPLLRSPQYA